MGGHNILPMKELVAMLAQIGCEKVRTYIQSGNAIFLTREGDRREIARKITQNISARYGFAPKVLLLTPAELQRAVADNPFKEGEGKTVHFFFLDLPPADPDLDRLAALRSKSEQYELRGTIFYLFTPEGVGRSKLAAKVEQCLGVPVTGRNWNTVRKLLAMVGDKELPSAGRLEARR